MVPAFVLVVCVAVAGASLAGGDLPVPSDQEAPASTLPAVRTGAGEKAVAIELAYKVLPAGEPVPSAIALYAWTGDETAGRVLVAHIFPFAGPNSDGIRNATVLVPRALADQLGTDPVHVEITYDGTSTNAPTDVGTLSLEAATIVNGEM